ncbi:hypothetical protein PLANPX_0451 [Lacipirellula parvula]|uniref:Uncharacterized protein n=1 Tax=Lacipirellula parvula TaxID=2650471 RepID=A0A5K7XCM1_9BACT|nr:hypothetical protein PLANPX_0451 [Lacipirellula parvula]
MILVCSTVRLAIVVCAANYPPDEPGGSLVLLLRTRSDLLFTLADSVAQFLQRNLAT